MKLNACTFLCHSYIFVYLVVILDVCTSYIFIMNKSNQIKKRFVSLNVFANLKPIPHHV